MARIAFILLCHKDPEGIIAQAERLTAVGDYMAIHFDGRARKSDYDRIRTALKDNPNVVFAARRVKCGWGEWSLVEATLEAVKAAVSAFPRATHFYMLSGDCMAIKTAEYAHDFLDREDVDYIESFDFFASDWIKTGMKEDRLIYRHFFNERTQKWLFYTAFKLQRNLGIRRRVPSDIQMMIGSQWWCLRRRTVEWVLDFCRKRRDVMRFFRTTWIPDETFFQTVVRHLVPENEIRVRTLTFLMFTDYGMPVVFCNDHYDLLLGQDYLFARKISPDAEALKSRLGAVYSSTGRDFALSNEGRSLFRFLTGRGRIGRRFAPRFWENETSLGRDRELMLVICKKWHVGKRLVDRARAVAGLSCVDYLFNEENAELPELGGIQTTLEKRNRHRRALLRMLFDYFRTDSLVACVDPASFDLIKDVETDNCTVRLLEIECDFSDDYLIGHARRVGLAGEATAAKTVEKLLPTIRYDIRFESEQLRDSGYDGYFRIRQSATPGENAVALAGFFGISLDKAHEIATTDVLFVD